MVIADPGQQRSRPPIPGMKHISVDRGVGSGPGGGAIDRACDPLVAIFPLQPQRRQLAADELGDLSLVVHDQDPDLPAIVSQQGHHPRLRQGRREA